MGGADLSAGVGARGCPSDPDHCRGGSSPPEAALASEGVPWAGLWGRLLCGHRLRGGEGAGAQAPGASLTCHLSSRPPGESLSPDQDPWGLLLLRVWPHPAQD